MRSRSPLSRLLLELLEALDLAHQLERLARSRARAGPWNELAVAALELLQRADVLELLEQALELGARLVVLELVVAQLLDARRTAARQLSRNAALGLRRVARSPRSVERVALEVEQLLEPLGASRSSARSRLNVAVALAHRLAQLLEELVEPHDPHALELEALAQQPVERLLHVVGVREVLGRACSNTCVGGRAGRAACRPSAV